MRGRCLTVPPSARACARPRDIVRESMFSALDARGAIVDGDRARPLRRAPASSASRRCPRGATRAAFVEIGTARRSTPFRPRSSTSGSKVAAIGAPGLTIRASSPSRPRRRGAVPPGVRSTRPYRHARRLRFGRSSRRCQGAGLARRRGLRPIVSIERLARSRSNACRKGPTLLGAHGFGELRSCSSSTSNDRANDRPTSTGALRGDRLLCSGVPSTR